MIDIYKNSRTLCFLLIFTVFISCSRPDTVGEKKVNDLLNHNKNEIVNIINILNNDSFCLQIKGEPKFIFLNTGNTYNISLRINKKI